ncbi:hypothetical protein AB205_0041520 [Aquarana catesbeiana]|uniref:Uncharacterized protein n=1 Tax=Aquarana catesbeiana TaxID=8400 RepID=A0A2G9Q1N4_AQUCT|nr:hypothetical protein AB205_0041520 [Aquarana catesbeiana]PIO09515.1 hypothetical protein AB205_0041520 [Aquarana catesbeiana]PIO09516.1 hypothetical protein AB205_0041520 [Aquarana catesbeiana]
MSSARFFGFSNWPSSIIWFVSIQWVFLFINW